MYYQFPLQTLARSNDDRPQLDFARNAKLVLPESDEVFLEPFEDGLAIFAANEDALVPPRQLLEEVYGAAVEIRPPNVRLIAGEPMQEPVMNVRVRAQRCHIREVLHILRFRGVRIVEECLRPREFIVRGQAPMRNLMGLPEELAGLTEGVASHWIRLAHYAPVPEAGDAP